MNGRYVEEYTDDELWEPELLTEWQPQQKSPGTPVKKKRKRKKKKHRLLKLILILLLIVTVLFGSFYRKLDRVRIAGTAGLHDFSGQELLGDAVLTQDDLDRIDQIMRLDKAPVSDRMLHVLLIGSDEREGEDQSRSDAMMLLSFNLRRRQITMTSLMRDMYVIIPGHGCDRINEAYFRGGEKLLMDTIEANFKIRVDMFAAVDFAAFTTIVDELGGMEIDVTEAEIPHVQGVTHSGKQWLNGAQTLDYCRIRKVGNDFERTQRQRTAMGQIFEKFREEGTIRAIRQVLDVLPYIRTNIPFLSAEAMLLLTPYLLSCDLVGDRIPADGLWWDETTAGGQQVLGLDFAANQAHMASVINAEEPEK